MSSRERSRSSAFVKQIVTGRVRRWERRPVYVNHVRVYRWVPKEARQTKIVSVTGDGDIDDGSSETFPITRARGKRQRSSLATRSSSRIREKDLQASKQETETPPQQQQQAPGGQGEKHPPATENQALI